MRHRVPHSAPCHTHSHLPHIRAYETPTTIMGDMDMPNSSPARVNQKWKVSRDIVRPEYAERYGWKRHNGDEISTALAAFCGSGAKFQLSRLVKVAFDNELAAKMKEWGDQRGKGNGLLRMLLGAQLRKRLRYGYDVLIGDTVIKGDPVEEPRPLDMTRAESKEPRRSIAELVQELEPKQLPVRLRKKLTLPT